MASEWPLRPKTSHFRSPVCSSYVLTPHNASMNDPETGLGLHQLGGRAQQGLAWKLKVGRGTWFLVNILCFIIYTCCKRKRKFSGRNWSQTAYLRSKCTVRWDRTVRFGTVLLLIPYYTVKDTIRRIPYRIYGVILEIRRSATALIIVQRIDPIVPKQL